MSNEAINWAKSVPVADPGRRLVLMILADYADAEWSTFVGQDRLAAESLVSKRTVQRILAEFEDRGLITRDERRRPDGYRTSDRITLHRFYSIETESQATPCHVTSEPISRDNGTDLRRQPEQPQVTPGVHAEPSVEALVDPSVETPSPLSADVARLCEMLADRVGQQQNGRRPSINRGWHQQMRLLIERGPLGRDQPEPISPDRVAATIRHVFEQMADPDRGGFCWAAQVRSPEALRRHWDRMGVAVENIRKARRSPVDRALERMGMDTKASVMPLDLFSSYGAPASVGARRALGG
jgi:hypothetical protein